jgi:prevent-host-death family protein
VDEDQVAVTDARANLSELVASVRLQNRCIWLTQHGRRRVAVLPLEIGEAIERAGGVTAALKLLTPH